jgi:hypothetical protein
MPEFEAVRKNFVAAIALSLGKSNFFEHRETDITDNRPDNPGVGGTCTSPEIYCICEQ